MTSDFDFACMIQSPRHGMVLTRQNGLLVNGGILAIEDAIAEYEGYGNRAKFVISANFGEVGTDYVGYAFGQPIELSAEYGRCVSMTVGGERLNMATDISFDEAVAACLDVAKRKHECGVERVQSNVSVRKDKAQPKADWYSALIRWLNK